MKTDMRRQEVREDNYYPLIGKVKAEIPDMVVYPPGASQTYSYSTEKMREYVGTVVTLRADNYRYIEGGETHTWIYYVDPIGNPWTEEMMEYIREKETDIRIREDD